MTGSLKYYLFISRAGLLKLVLKPTIYALKNLKSQNVRFQFLDF